MGFKKQVHFSSDMGRMGNQMFQYACALQLQQQYGFATSLSHLDKMEYFKLGRSERVWNKIKSFLFFRLWSKVYGMDIYNTEAKCLIADYTQALQAFNKPTQVWGFFQSPRYFDQAVAEVKKRFEVKDRYRKGFEDFLQTNGLQASGYLAVHLRLTDYKGFTIPFLEGNDMTLPLAYYTKALEEMTPYWKGPVVFVSDDPDAVAQLFPDIPNKIISRNDAITDFLILQHAGALIISNSTYAWWAAFLNNCADHLKMAPKYFLGYKEKKEVPINIYPGSWVQIEN
jgi:hypothetical protein